MDEAEEEEERRRTVAMSRRRMSRRMSGADALAIKGRLALPSSMPGIEPAKAVQEEESEPSTPSMPSVPRAERHDRHMVSHDAKFDAEAEREYSRVVHKAVAFADKEQQKADMDALYGRRMVRSNCQLTLQIVKHEAHGKLKYFLMDITNSVRLDEFTKAVRQRCGGRLYTPPGAGKGEGKPEPLRLLWLHPDGDTIPLEKQSVFEQYVLTMWCRQPWVVHVHYPSECPLHPIALSDKAVILFDRYDVNDNGRVERRELVRLFRDLNLEQLQVSTKLVDEFIDGEFRRLDKDNSGGLTIDEFTECAAPEPLSHSRHARDCPQPPSRRAVDISPLPLDGCVPSAPRSYVTSMTRWMRSALLYQANDHNVFHMLASRAVEVHVPPTVVPPPSVVDDVVQGEQDGGFGGISDEQSPPLTVAANASAPVPAPPPVSLVAAHKFGIRVHIPPGAVGVEHGLKDGGTSATLAVSTAAAKISIQTHAPSEVFHLSEYNLHTYGRKLGEFMFSPVVQVDFPAFEDGEEPPELGEQQAPPFRTPLTLIMPHCFDPKDGKESCVLLGAAHGAMGWERINNRVHDVELRQGEMAVKIPCAES